jgi:hypothetical protein
MTLTKRSRHITTRGEIEVRSNIKHDEFEVGIEPTTFEP